MDPEEQQKQQSPGFDSAMAREIDELLQDSLFPQRTEANTQASGHVNESASSTDTTPDPLKTAFINEKSIDNNDQQSQISFSQQQQSQTTRETFSTIYGLISTIIEEEEEEEEQQHPFSHLRTPSRTMISTGTMPRTSLATAPVFSANEETIDLCSSSTPSITELISPTEEIIESIPIKTLPQTLQ